MLLNLSSNESGRARRMCLCLLSGLFLHAFLYGCATLSEQERHDKLRSIDLFVKQTVETIIRENPEMNSEFEAASGYAILSLSTAKIPYVGYGDGKGILVDKLTDQRIYLRTKIKALGSGLGAERFRITLLFDDEKAIRAFKTGKIKFGARADVAAKSSDETKGVLVEGKRSTQEGYTVYVFTDAGVAATMTLWMLSISPDKALN